ncbi:30S ribosomal protein S12 methylthiotransferase RimO [Athalassotoga sp.]|uniref:30S ribosomal protein S12 methylthiotransferase RimO n=1 Tax=Athalassotoga sp. TaxID=2022597 RepID=UPI003D00C8FE
MKVWMDVLGCPKNEADSDVVKAILMGRGHEIVDDLEDANVAVINTCAFVSDAKKESIDEIFDVIKFRKNKSFKIIVHGCLAQRYFKALKVQIPEVDAFLGVVSPQRVADAVENFSEFYGSPEPVYGFLGRTSTDTPYAYVKIGDGCDRKCTFCAIPSIKGPLKNRDYEDILKEVEFLVKTGKKEIILVSQDSTGYADGGKTLIDLLLDMDNIPGDFWIRLLYLYPDGVNEALVETIAKSRKILHYFDIPVQHASERILKMMKRNPDVKLLEDKISYIRERIPDAIFRTSFITGFPSENDEDFEKILNFLGDVKFDRVGVFIYSDEAGTVAHGLLPKVKKTVAQSRFEGIMDFQREINIQKNKSFVGKQFKVIVEGIEDGMYVGRTYMDAPEIDGAIHFSSANKVEMGEFANVAVKSYEFYDLEGEVV